jgi:hypothetical protein
LATHAPARANPRAVSLEIEDQVVRLRKTLTKRGLDAGAETIAAHLATVGVDPVPATSTIWRTLFWRGFVTPQLQKPRSSWRTFVDITHWRLADGSEVEILNILDDRSRVNIAAKARCITLGPQVVDTPAGPTALTPARTAQPSPAGMPNTPRNATRSQDTC